MSIFDTTDLNDIIDTFTETKNIKIKMYVVIYIIIISIILFFNFS